MDRKIIFILLGNALVAFAFTFALPVIYAAGFMRSVFATVFFLALAAAVAFAGKIFVRLGRRHRRRLPLWESAVAMLLIFPLVAAFGAIPFWFLGWLPPLDAFLETVSDVTSGGISLLSARAPYVLRLWQSALMWFGSLVFLVMLVTMMPEVSGSFGMTLSLHGGQNLSPRFSQMNLIARRMLRVYAALTVLSAGLFKLAGLGGWDSILLAMRCISTGGGDFFPARGNAMAEYAAIFSMLLACGNFLFYYRLAVTLPPAAVNQQENILRRGISYVKTLRKNFLGNVIHFYSNTEVKVSTVIIFAGVWIILLSGYRWGHGESFRHALFHVISFMSTTGINLESLETAHDFDRFFIFMLAIFGGCMGSVTGGLKIIRVVVLAKLMAAELTKVMHPRMVTSIRVNSFAVPPKIIGRILGFFFLSALTLFVCAAVLSFMEPKFSEAVAISVACLTNVGVLPGICDAALFLSLPAAGKIFCVAILIVGRLEIFALLIAAAGLVSRRSFKEW
ncbi:MAG: TrkH family potassium uptake protein [Selenomonadaceae bacterium]|nr:TrkH family potassium uptake protein [Selenomonadaceae bacterium]